MITVFTEHITDRLSYVLDFCFQEKGIDYRLVTSIEEWRGLDRRDLNYSNLDLPSQFQIKPLGILFESDIYQSKKVTWSDNQLKIDGHFDELGIIFYLLSRYEDYFSDQVDQHGRRSGADNILVKLGLHRIALVDRLVKDIWEELLLDYSKVKSKFKLLPTFDIDIAWAYKNRKFIRSMGAMVKGKKPLERIKVLSGIQKDPYDTYDTIREVATKTENLICFILLGDWGKYDKNIHWKNAAYGSLIRGLNLEGEIGIHPSYASYLNTDMVVNEIGRLETITGHDISLNRQHFLRFKVPDSYLLLESAGITEDHSMGFADEVGFRAGTCFPFFFFDLLTNRKTTLKIRPFTYMDSALKDYLKESSEKSKEIIDELMKEVRSVGGNFVFIWHNSSIHDKGEWKGWKSVLDYTVKVGLEND